MLGSMAIGKGNPVYVNEYLRHWIKTEWLSKGHTGKELADRCGVDKATISDFKNGKRGAGYDLAAGIAAVQGRTRDEMERDAQEWWRTHGEKTLKTDPYPNRAAALEFLRKDIPEPVIESVMRINLDATGDPSRAWWVTRIMSELDLYRASKIS